MPYHLPQHDPDPRRRADALARARAAYAPDRSFHGLLFVRHLPWRERFGPAYLAHGAALAANLAANRGLVRLRTRRAPQAYADLCPLLPEPPLATRAPDADTALGWARLAGPNPAWLQRMLRPDPSLGLADADVRGGDLQAALRAGRLYVVDYRTVGALPAGTRNGQPKQLLPTVAAFEATDTGLRPLAIAPDGRRTAEHAVRPSAGDRWRLARLAVGVADANAQGIVAHMGWCHLVAQAFLLASHACLAPRHPLHALLGPHFEHTLAVNHVARTSVLVPGGTQDQLLAPTLDAQLDTLRAAVDAVALASLDPTVDHADRGVDDAQALPVYPFRDDGLLHWEAQAPFFTTWVDRIYPDDAAVRDDAELQALLPWIAAPEGAGLPGLVAGERLDDRDDLVYLLRRLVHRLTAFHQAINDGNYDWAGYGAAQPTHARGPLEGAVDAQGLVDRLLPLDDQLALIDTTFNVARLKANHLGTYPPFGDPVLDEAVVALQARLATVEATIATRNGSRFLPYRLLLPSNTTRSINA